MVLLKDSEENDRTFMITVMALCIIFHANGFYPDKSVIVQVCSGYYCTSLIYGCPSIDITSVDNFCDKPTLVVLIEKSPSQREAAVSN